MQYNVRFFEYILHLPGINVRINNGRLWNLDGVGSSAARPIERMHFHSSDPVSFTNRDSPSAEFLFQER